MLQIPVRPTRRPFRIAGLQILAIVPELEINAVFVTVIPLTR